MDVTSHIDFNANNTQIINVLTRQISTLDLNMFSVEGLGILDWQEVIFTNTESGLRLFAGYTQHGDITSFGGGTRQEVAPLSCGDYSCLLDHIYMDPVEYVADVTDRQIILDAFSKYAPAFDLTNVVALQTYPGIQIPRQSLRQLLDQMASGGSNADWLVDYYKKLYYFYRRTTYYAPFGLSDVRANIDLVNVFPFTNVVRVLDGTGVVNRVTVVGQDVTTPANPLLLRMTDFSSVDLYKLFLDGVITNQDISKSAVAAAVARGYLDLNDSGNNGFTLTCYREGLMAGMLLNFECLAHSYTSTVQIQKVTTAFDQGGFAHYDLEVGLYRQDLKDIIVAIARKKLPTEFANNPVSNMWLQGQDDLSILDSNESHSITPSAPTYSTVSLQHFYLCASSPPLYGPLVDEMRLTTPWGTPSPHGLYGGLSPHDGILHPWTLIPPPTPPMTNEGLLYVPGNLASFRAQSAGIFTIPYDASFDLSGDHTIEFIWNPQDDFTQHVDPMGTRSYFYYRTASSPTRAYKLWHSKSDYYDGTHRPTTITFTFGVEVWDAGAIIFSASWDFIADTFTAIPLSSHGWCIDWHSFALVRSGDTWTVYMDGIGFGSATGAITVPSIPTSALIGVTDPGNYGWHGYIGEFRISNIARYLSNYAQPITYFTAD